MFNIIPHNPKVTIDRNAEGKPIRYCIDAKTEQSLQLQRMYTMGASGLVIYAAWKMKSRWWLRLSVAGIGVAMFIASNKARQIIKSAEKL